MIGLLLLAGRYGYHRDELYFRLAGRHLAFGYVDQPPMTPLIARVEQVLLGDSVWAMRVWPALVAGAVVIMAAILCREFGGGRRAQALVAVATAASPGILLAGHLLTTETTDLLVWQVILWLFVRLLRTGDGRWWVPFGTTVGIGLQNKDLPAFLVVALLVGLVLSRRGGLVARGQFLVGALLAVVIAAPAVVWQLMHGAPELVVAQAQRHGTSPAQYLLLQLIIINPAMIPMLVRGVRRLWRAPSYRSLVWAFTLLELFFLLSGGKPYYPAPILLTLAAAGTAAAAPEVAQAADRRWSRAASSYAAISVAALVLLPAALPVLPEAAFADSPYSSEQDQAATIGWPQLAAQADALVGRLPPEARQHAVVLARDYSEAGALERFGDHAVPVVSGHNALWGYRRPPDSTRVTIVIGYSLGELARWFAACTGAGTVHIPYNVDDGATGAPLSVCGSTRQRWSALWPTFGHNN